MIAVSHLSRTAEPDSITLREVTVLRAERLTKRYRGIPVVDQVTFEVKPGEVVGYLGPNGSGKSTTVKMLTTLLEPSHGQILFNGQPIQVDLNGYKKRLGYVPEESHLYPYLTGTEYLQLVGRLRSIPERLLNEKIDAFLRLFSLHPYRHSAISAYSNGMRRKILISAALLHNPDVVIFDEPDSGLDIGSGLVLRSLVQTLAEESKIVLYCSHLLDVVEKLCSTVVILYRGRVVANDSIDHLRTLMRRPSLEEVFTELVRQEDANHVARDIVDVMKY